MPIHLQLFISLNYSGHLYNLPVECKKVSVSIYPRRLSLNVTVFFFSSFSGLSEHINYLSPVITIDQQGAMPKRMRREDEDENDVDDDNSGIVSVFSCYLL